MAEEFLMVSRRQMDEFRVAVERVKELYEGLLEGAGTVSFPTMRASLLAAPLSNGPPTEKKKYTVGRGAYSYADVVWKEVEEDTFFLDDVMDQVEPLIETTSERWRDSFRRSVQNDERFMPVDDAPTGWFRKVRPGRKPVEQPVVQRREPERPVANYDDFQPPPFGDEDDDNIPF